MNKSVGTCLSALAALSLAIPVQAFESNSGLTATPVVTDVALTPSGELVGTILGKDGIPLANRKVRVMHKQALVAEVQTDHNGRYEVEGLRSGFHVVQSPNTELACRFWAADVAPPSARNGLVFAEDAVVVRGQNSAAGRGLFGGLGPAGVPWVGIGAFVGASVAVGVTTADGNTADVLPASP